jgi:hypothetical protein
LNLSSEKTWFQKILSNGSTCTRYIPGFCEAIRVDGDDRLDPLIEGCSIKCSGDDAVVTVGRSRPTFRNCDVGGKKAGIQCMQESAPEIIDCMLANSSMQAVVGLYTLNLVDPVA